MALNTDLLPPRYRGATQIARGGMGEIYRATDTALGRAVAIKLLSERYAADVSVRERFTREALAAARLSTQPHSITIYDVGEHEGRPYIVMEYLSGGSLEDVLRKEGAQPPQRAFDWLEQTAEALDAAHREGVVHRDVKPGNLMLDREGNVTVADFGIASAAGTDSLTMTGTVLGTAGYLSPEQARGDRATPASDRYALGVVAFELLTGRRPFEAESPTVEASSHVHAEVPSVSDRQGSSLPVDLDPVFAKALAKDPEGRYGSAKEFVQALRAAMAGAAGATRRLTPVPLQATATTAELPRAREDRGWPAAPPARRPPRSARVWSILVGLLLLGVAAGALAAYLLTRGNNGHSAGQTTTVEQRVTTAPPATTPATSGLSGHALNDAGYAKMRAGDYTGALPLLQQAVQKLIGAGPADPYEGYANYNLGYTLLQLGRCNEAIPYLQRARQLEPQRPEPGQALESAQACSSG